MIKFWQWHVQREMTDAEFVQYGREVYGYDVPTFRNALRMLLRSIVRERILRNAIPDVLAANDYLNNREMLSSTEQDGVKLYLDFEREAGNQSLTPHGPNEPQDMEIDEFYPDGVPWRQLRRSGYGRYS